MPINLPYESLTERAFQLINAGEILNGILELHTAWLAGSCQARLIFENHKSIDRSQFPQLSFEYVSESQIAHPYELALCYLAGIGVEQSDRRAEQILTQLADENVAEAEALLGHLAYCARAKLDVTQKQRYVFAEHLLQKASNAGISSAKTNLGGLYSEGIIKSELTQEQRNSLVVRLFQEAMRSGDSTAVYNLAVMYLDGQVLPEINEADEDVAMDSEINQAAAYAHAASLFRQAAETGFVFARSTLARMYFLGLVELELSQAERDLIAFGHLQQAVATGCFDAMVDLGVMYKEGRAENIDQYTSAIKARTLFLKAAQAGNPIAQFELAEIYFIGYAVEEHLTQLERRDIAIKWYQAVLANPSATPGRAAQSAVNIAHMYKGCNQIHQALPMLSTASVLYGKNDDEGLNEVIQRLNTFDDSPAKTYVQTQLDRIKQEDISFQCEALKGFNKPSDYQPFFGLDMKTVGTDSLFREAFEQWLETSAEKSADLDPSEQCTLVSLIIQHAQFQIQTTQSNPDKHYPDTLNIIKLHLEMLLNHNLQASVALLKDKETIQIISDMAENLLAHALVAPQQHRELILSFIRLSCVLPLNATLWKEHNLLKLCTLLFTDGQCFPQGNKMPTPTQMHIIVLQASQNEIFTAIERKPGEPAIDHQGLQLMNIYDVLFDDVTEIKQEAKNILQQFTAQSSSMPVLSQLQPKTQFFNPLMNALYEIGNASNSYLLLLQLLKLRDLYATESCTDKLKAGLQKLLTSAGCRLEEHSMSEDLTSCSSNSSIAMDTSAL